VCCNGVIVPKTTAGCDIPNVCRQSPTRFLTKTQACCGGVLYPRSKTKDHGCCQNVAPFKYKDEICCFGTVHARHGNAKCCGTRAYDSDTQMCCAGEVVTKTLQGCPGLNTTIVDICKKSPVPRFFRKEGYGCCAGQVGMKIIARILKAHLHSLSEGSIWASPECQCCFWIAGGLVSYLTRWLVTTHPPAIQKQHWHPREAQIEPPLIECEWAFRIQAYIFERSMPASKFYLYFSISSISSSQSIKILIYIS
jgi:hypothetical protein